MGIKFNSELNANYMHMFEYFSRQYLWEMFLILIVIYEISPFFPKKSIAHRNHIDTTYVAWNKELYTHP